VLAFTFPGQGSQKPGMGLPWMDHPSWELVAEASELAGRDVEHLLCRADQSELTPTANAQLATFVLSLVVVDAVERVGLAPTMCAGHSLGEYSALAAAGALALDDGVRLVAERGDAMHHAAQNRPGTMAAVVGADEATVATACQRADGDVWVANDNAPGQVVVAGDPAAVERAGAIAKELGARKVLPLTVAGAFHTPFMAPALDRLGKALAATRFEALDVPVVANVDARPHHDAAAWPDLLAAQLCQPVRWRQSLATLAELGATVVAELGAGGVLTGMARRALPGARAVSVATPDDLDAVVEAAAGTGVWPRHADAHQGERLTGADRVVVSPAAGVFRGVAALGTAPGPGALAQPGPANPTVGVGELLGHVGAAEVRSPFAGIVVGWLVHPDERVAAGQPVAWLRTADDPTAPAPSERTHR
jgi:[acyl-carrier-protein] S-malonyltransferase